MHHMYVATDLKLRPIDDRSDDIQRVDAVLEGVLEEEELLRRPKRCRHYQYEQYAPTIQRKSREATSTFESRPSVSVP